MPFVRNPFDRQPEQRVGSVPPPLNWEETETVTDGTDVDAGDGSLTINQDADPYPGSPS